MAAFCLSNMWLTTALCVLASLRNLVPATALPNTTLDALSILKTRFSPGSRLALNWTGDPCLHSWIGVQCNSHGEVIVLDLASSNLAGPIPHQLGSIFSLKVLNLSLNQLTGSIPSALSDLSNLQQLDLKRNNLTGFIPQELGFLFNIQHLHLDNNALTGSIPPQLGDLSNLISLRLPRNNLTGDIPPELGKLTNLTDLCLSENNLTGTIPPELGNLHSLQKISLIRNSIGGPIPPEISSLSQLKTLALFENKLNGTIPPDLGNLSNLTILALFKNTLTGTIPPEIGYLSNLIYLALYNNNLTGSIPPQLGKLRKLRGLSLSQNNLTGPIPPEFNALNLTILDLSQNYLNGSVPPALTKTLNCTVVPAVITVDVVTVTLTRAASSIALNCIGIYPGHFYEPDQRDSQVCSMFYPELRCRCKHLEVVGISGSCKCVVPFQARLLFTFVKDDDLQVFSPRLKDDAMQVFSTSLKSTLQQLTALMSVSASQVAPVNFSLSPTRLVILVLNVLPTNGHRLPSNEIARIRHVLEEENGNVTVPDFNPGFYFSEGNELTSPTEHKDVRAIALAIAAAGLLLGLAAAIAFAFFLLRKGGRLHPISFGRRLIPGSKVRSWKFSELSSATNGFSDECVIGRGGYGTVYRGTLDNTTVAVKRLATRASLAQEDFIREVEIIGTIHHRNLVALLGYCIEGEELLLVFEFMANGSLEDWLFQDDKNLPWDACMRILVDTACAVGYLHHGCKQKIIHRDIKPGNILLDNSYRAHVSDFGLAKSTLVDATHVTTTVRGTLGYLAPEYAQTGRLTEKSDVYSFGVLMLAVISNRPPLERRGQVSWVGLVDEANTAFQQDHLESIVARHFDGTYDHYEAQRIMSVALMCVRSEWQQRPSMEQILHMMCGGETGHSSREHKTPVVWYIPSLSQRWNSDAYRRLSTQEKAHSL